MSYSNDYAWNAAIEEIVNDAPVANIDIDINEAADIDVDEDGAPLEAVDANGEPTLDVVETELAEQQIEVEEVDETVENLNDTATVLENYSLAIESRIDYDGGMTPGELQMMLIGLRGKRLANPDRLMPSGESMSYNRFQASVEALDSLKKGIKKIWYAIKDAIKALMTKVREWANFAFSGSNKLLKRANAVRRQINTLDKDIKPPKDKKIEFGSIKSFFIEGKGVLKDGRKAADNIGKMGAVIENITAAQKTWYDFVEECKRAIEYVVKKKKEKKKSDSSSSPINDDLPKLPAPSAEAKSNVPVMDEDINNRVKAIKNIVYSGFSRPEDFYEDKNNTGKLVTEPLPGGVTLAMDVYKPGEQFLVNSLFEKYRGPRIDDKKDGPKRTDEVTLMVLTLDEMRLILDRVIEIMQFMVAQENSYSRVDKVVNDYMRYVDGIVQKADVEGKDLTDVTKLLRGFSSFIKEAPKHQIAIFKWVITVCSDYTNYCTRSLSYYKKPKKG